jgi:hypothetical protein
MPIFTYGFYSKAVTSTTEVEAENDIDKLHIIVQAYHRDQEGPVELQDDPAKGDYGSFVESECGLKGILIKTAVDDAVRVDDFGEMGLKHFRDKYGGISKTVYFFMPPVLRVSIPIAISDGMIPNERICKKCKDNFEARMRRRRTTMTTAHPHHHDIKNMRRPPSRQKHNY